MLKKILMFSCLLLCLTGCAHISLWNAIKFAGVSFTDVNPETARIALVFSATTPLAQGLQHQSSKIIIQASHNGQMVIDDEIPLEVINSGPEMTFLPNSIPRDRVFVIRVQRSAVAHARMLQLKTAEFLESPGGDNSLTFGVVVGDDNTGSDGESDNEDESPADPCANNAPLSDMVVWVRLDEDSRYTRLLKEDAIAKIANRGVQEAQCAS